MSRQPGPIRPGPKLTRLTDTKFEEIQPQEGKKPAYAGTYLKLPTKFSIRLCPTRVVEGINLRGRSFCRQLGGPAEEAAVRWRRVEGVGQVQNRSIAIIKPDGATERREDEFIQASTEISVCLIPEERWSGIEDVRDPRRGVLMHDTEAASHGWTHPLLLELPVPTEDLERMIERASNGQVGWTVSLQAEAECFQDQLERMAASPDDRQELYVEEGCTENARLLSLALEISLLGKAAEAQEDSNEEPNEEHRVHGAPVPPEISPLMTALRQMVLLLALIAAVVAIGVGVLAFR